MAWGDRKRQGPEERRALTLPVPPGRSDGTLNLTVPEDEFRVAALGRVASSALVGRKDSCRPTLSGNAGVVISIGSISCQGG
jgi:hypothetical protein